VVVLSGGTVVFSGDVDALLADCGRLEAEGLWTPPEVVMVQLMAQRAGRLSGALLLDPEGAGVRLAGSAS
jgi:hypothetical protein